MRDLLPNLPTLVLPLIGAPAAPGSLSADVPGLVSDVDRRFAALEAYCGEVGDIVTGDALFDRLDKLMMEAIHALAEAPSCDVAGIVAKADALLRAPIEEDFGHCDRIGASLARDVLRLLGKPSNSIGDHHG